jgi:Tfp pilus assembly protein PilF
MKHRGIRHVVFTLSCVLLASGSVFGQAEEEVKHSKQEADLHYQKGVTAFQTEDYYLAAKEFNIALSFAPDHQEASDRLKEIKGIQTQIYMEEGIDASLDGEHEKAITFLLQSVAANPDNTDIRRQIERMYPKAIEQLKQQGAQEEQISQLNNQATAWRLLSSGLSSFNANDLSSAQEQISMALRIDDNFALAHLYLGIVTCLQDDTSTAKAEFEKALEIDDLNVAADVGPYVWLVFCEAKGDPFPPVPVPTAGKLIITSEPRGASILINGKPSARVTPAELNLLPGDYTIGLELEGYEPYMEKLRLLERQVKNIKTPLVKQTQLRITSEPSGIKVEIVELSGYKTPLIIETPITLSDFEPGDYEARASSKGYDSGVQRFRVDPQEINVLRIRLSPKSRLKMAGLSLLFPGTGQYYGGRSGSGKSFLIAGLLAIAGTTAGYLLYDQSVDDYGNSVEEYNKAFSPAKVESTRQAMTEAHDSADMKFYLRQGVYIALGVVWGSNILHAMMAGPATAPELHAKLPNWEIVPRVTPQIAQVAVLYRF